MGHVLNLERSLTGQITRNFYLTTPLYSMFYPAFIRSLLPYIYIDILTYRTPKQVALECTSEGVTGA